MESDCYNEIPTKLQKFRFTNLFVVSLLKCVCYHDDHRAERGTKYNVFAIVSDDLLTLVYHSQWSRVQKPTVQTFRDKFRDVMTARKAANARNERASGISENHWETEQLLGELLLKQKECEE